ncbi:MAG: hypothetical protein ACJ751_17530 [Niastella sp.]|jgi:hypothetical protein|uniref:hypothetical protein n=1 Tax=Niastella sp. TaxID=1869183 RepID=UPI00389AA95A
MKKYVFALLSIGFILYACKKDHNNSNDSNTKMQLITSATWKYDSVGPAIVSSSVQPCDKDNTITFKSDSTGVLNAGATKCNASDPQTTAFRWWFKDNGATLYSPDPLFGSAFTGSFKVAELTTTRLRIQKDTTVPGFGPITIELYLKH